MHRRVIIESPFAGDRARNVQYGLRALRDSLMRGEAPFASHLLYTMVLDDKVKLERAHGISAGFEWGRVAEATVVYTDYGISAGMALGIEAAKGLRPVEYRTIGENNEGNPDEPPDGAVLQRFR